MVSLLLRRHPAKPLVLTPYDGLAESEVTLLPFHKPLRCALTRSRSARNQRHYWACLKALSEATSGAPPTALHKLLKFECGHVTPIRLADGSMKLVEDSTSFENMEETEFNIYKKRAFLKAQELFGIDPADLIAAGDELLGSPTAQNGVGER